MSANQTQGTIVGVILAVVSLGVAAVSGLEIVREGVTPVSVYNTVIALNIAAVGAAHAVPGWDATASLRHPGYLPIVAGWIIYVATSVWFVAQGKLGLFVSAHLTLAVLAAVGLFVARQFGSGPEASVS